MNLCQTIKAPIYAYDHLLKWAQESKLAGYQFSSNAPSRKTFLDELYKRFNMKGAKPTETEITLYPDKKATITTFSFVEMVSSLTSDESLMVEKNLLIGKNPNDFDELTDIHTGDWFKAATLLLCINGKDVLCPIILFIDKTQIDQLSKWSLEPVLFTLGIFNVSTRNMSTAWRPLGLVTNTVRMSSASRAQLGKQVSLNYLPCYMYRHYPHPILSSLREMPCKTTTAY
jgi:hypothetical protein